LLSLFVLKIDKKSLSSLRSLGRSVFIPNL
jgi:hypothetical protein